MIDYEARAPSQRTWGVSLFVWLLVAGFCAFVEFAGWFGTNGRTNGLGDIAFIVVFAVVGVAALTNALRPVRRAR